ncbi:MAG: hypothetical protein QM731_12230 [Chitinophagaceae bacterium]
MKKLLIVLFSIGLAFGASAQKVVRGGGGHYSRPPRVVVGVGAGFGYYSPFYSPFGFYSPWGYPYAYNNYYSKPSRLDLEVQDIKVDYSDRIQSVKLDESLSRKEKRQKIRELKTERDKAVIQAKKDYYYKRSRSTKPYSNDSNSNSNNDNNTQNNNANGGPTGQ